MKIGLHAALELAVAVLRSPHGLQSSDRLEAAQVIRDFLGKKRLWSKLSMRKRRKKWDRRAKFSKSTTRAVG